MPRSNGSLVVGFLLLSLLQVMSQQPVHADPGDLPTPPVYNLRLLTDSTPDLSDIDSYLRSITSQHATQQDKAIAINLREREHYTRYFGHLADEDKSRTFRPLKNGKDPEGQHSHLGIRANGIWQYAPDLRNRFADQLVYDSADVTFGDARSGFAVKPRDAKAAGTVVFRVPASNIVTSAKLLLKVSRSSDSDVVSVSVSRTAGTSYQSAWVCTEKGNAMAVEIDLQPFVAGVSAYLVKVQLQGAGAGLESATIETITQINRAALPRLSRGGNRVQLTLGAQAETVQFLPSIVAGSHSETVHQEKSIDVETETGFYKPILRPAENNTAAHVTWKIATPTPITAINYGGTICVKTANDRTTLMHSFDGKDFVRDYEKSDGDEPFDLMINREVASIPVGQREAYLRYEFQTQRYARSYSGPGIQAARMLVQHEPRVKGFTPIEVTYCWIEHRESGDVVRQHTQRITSPAQEYSINVAGHRDPTMQWVRMNLQGSAPKGDKVTYGYSDGVDVGPGAGVKPKLYHWGRNIALAKPYKLTGPQHAKNRDAGGDLTDGIIAPPTEYVSEKFMPTNVMFEKDAAAVITLDLGNPQEVAAVRIHAGQEPGFKLAYPKVIQVEVSEDGKSFTKVGEAAHHQVFDPPADFQPWEQDDSPQYALLPAGGRLAYAYRVIFKRPQTARFVRVTCESQKDWGMLLSELQVFEQMTVQEDVPPHVYLPPLEQVDQSSHATGNTP